MAENTTTPSETTRKSNPRSIAGDPAYKYPYAYGCLRGMFQAIEHEVNYLDNQGETTIDIEYIKGFLERVAEVVDAVDKC